MSSSSLSDVLFGINTQKLDRIGALVRIQSDSAQLQQYEDAELTSEERLYTKIWSSNLLKTGFYTRGEVILTKGAPIREAHVIIQGQVIVDQEDSQVLMGPGCVLGLAEGLAGLPSRWTVHADSLLNTRLIPIERARDELYAAQDALRSICRVTISRIVGSDAP
ncbi:hypothetical protein MCEMSEM47_01771 [Burkholderiales bacterium]|jgi:hypothetical protein